MKLNSPVCFAIIICLPLMAFGQVVEPPGDFAGFIDWFKLALGTHGKVPFYYSPKNKKSKRILNGKEGPDFIMGIIFTNIFYSFLLSNRNFRGVTWFITYMHIMFSLSVAI